jgi:hypothetical protein
MRRARGWLVVALAAGAGRMAAGTGDAQACTLAQYGTADDPFPADGATNVPTDMRPRVGVYDPGDGETLSMTLLLDGAVVAAERYSEPRQPYGPGNDRWEILAPAAPLEPLRTYDLVVELVGGDPAETPRTTRFTTGAEPAVPAPPGPDTLILRADFVGPDGCDDGGPYWASLWLGLATGPADEAALWRFSRDGVAFRVTPPVDGLLRVEVTPGVETCFSVAAENESGAGGAAGSACCVTPPAACATDPAPDWCTAENGWELTVDCQASEPDWYPMDYVQTEGCGCDAVGRARDAGPAAPFLALALVLVLLPLRARRVPR